MADENMNAENNEEVSYNPDWARKINEGIGDSEQSEISPEYLASTRQEGFIPPEKNSEADFGSYREISQSAEVREAEMPQEPSGNNTMSGSMENMDDLTDMQFGAAKLFPKHIDADSVMVSRIDPGVFLSMLHLTSVNEIMKQDPKKAIDVNGIYRDNYTRLSIGLDGRGRIDIAELVGASREERRSEMTRGAGGI